MPPPRPHAAVFRRHCAVLTGSPSTYPVARCRLDGPYMRGAPVGHAVLQVRETTYLRATTGDAQPPPSAAPPAADAPEDFARWLRRVQTAEQLCRLGTPIRGSGVGGLTTGQDDSTSVQSPPPQQQLRLLAGLVARTLRSPLDGGLQAPQRASAVKSKGKTVDGPPSVDAPPSAAVPGESATDMATSMAAPVQLALVRLVLLRVAHLHACVQHSRTDPRHARWPWRAEVDLVVTVLAALPAVQRETNSCLILLLSLAARGPGTDEGREATRDTQLMACSVVAEAMEAALRARGGSSEPSVLPWLVIRLGAVQHSQEGKSREPWQTNDAVQRLRALAADYLCAAPAACVTLPAVADERTPAGVVSASGDAPPLPFSPPPSGRSTSPVGESVESGSLHDIVAALAWEPQTLVTASSAQRPPAGGASAGSEACEDWGFLLEEETLGLYASPSLREWVRARCAASAWPLSAQAAAADAPCVVEGGDAGACGALALSEMLRSAWEALESRSGASPQWEYDAVGHYQAMRRLLSALRRRQQVLPLLRLQALVTGIASGAPAVDKQHAGTMNITDAASFCGVARHWRRLILAGGSDAAGLCSGLLWRELVLFDANALTTLGHVSEHATDMDAGGAAALRAPLRALQRACMDHLVDLGDMGADGRPGVEHSAIRSERASKPVLRRVTPRTQRTLVSRLHEGLRLSCKALMRLGDVEGICAVHRECPTMGATWEVAYALTTAASSALAPAGAHEAALHAWGQLFASTQQQHATALPQRLRTLALEAVASAGARLAVVGGPSASSSPACCTGDPTRGDGTAATTTSHHRTGDALMELYCALRSWHPCLPPAVCAHALLRGVMSARGVSSQEGSTDAPSASSPAVHALLSACWLLRRLRTELPGDGLLTRTVELLTEEYLLVRSALLHTARTEPIGQEGHAAGGATRSMRNNQIPATVAVTAGESTLHLLERDVHSLLVDTLHRNPELPVMRAALTRFLRANDARDVELLLLNISSSSGSSGSSDNSGSSGHCTAPATGPVRLSAAYCEAALLTFPVVALEGLVRHLRAPSPLCTPSSTETSARGALLPSVVRARWLRSAEVALRHQREAAERACVPWQCVLCRLWNSRFSTACKQCGASSSPLVQCARCGSLSSAREPCCPVCTATFPAHDASLRAADTERHDAGAEGSRPADSLTHAAAYRAVFALRPWTCAVCRSANDARHALYCGQCGTVRARWATVLRDGAFTCRFCRQRNPMGALRPWCGACGALSERVSSAARGRHASPQPGASPRGAYRGPSLWLCVECRWLNPWVLVHCDCCGAGRPAPPPAGSHQQTPGSPEGDDTAHANAAVAAAPCIVLPWQQRQCASCRARSPLGSRVCRACGTSLVETARGSPVEESWLSGLPCAVQQHILGAYEQWRAGVVEAPVGSCELLCPEQPPPPLHAPRLTAAADEDRCLCCGRSLGPVPELSGGASAPLCSSCCCPHCGALRPDAGPVEQWVCLHEGCLHVNVSPERPTPSSQPPRCARCQHPRGGQVQYLWRSRQPLPPGQCDALEKNPFRCDADAGQQPPAAAATAAATVLDAVVLVPALSVRASAPLCTHCQAVPLPATNLLGVCPSCGHCGVAAELAADAHRDQRYVPASQATESGLHEGLRALLLSVFFRFLQAETCGHAAAAAGEARGSSARFLSSASALDALLLSARPILTSAPEALLPWRGRDPGYGLRGCVEPRVPIVRMPRRLLHSATVDSAKDARAAGGAGEPSGDAGELREEEEEEVPHTFVLCVRHTIRALCALADAQTREIAAAAADPAARGLHSRRRRLLLSTAVELVEAVNRSTDYDELGFPVLSELCVAVRPGEARHIEAQTRWAYLRDMRLSREWITNGVLCPWCLDAHPAEAPCSPMS